MGRSLGSRSMVILSALQSRVCYGLDIVQRTGLLAGTVYTTLRRLENRGLVRGSWEDPDIAEAERRPRRRYYELTPIGEAQLEESRKRMEQLFASAPLGEESKT